MQYAERTLGRHAVRLSATSIAVKTWSRVRLGSNHARRAEWWGFRAHATRMNGDGTCTYAEEMPDYFDHGTHSASSSEQNAFERLHPRSITIKDFFETFRARFPKALDAEPAAKKQHLQQVVQVGDDEWSFREGAANFVHDNWSGNFPHRSADSYEFGVVVSYVREHVAQHGSSRMLLIGLGPGLLIDALYEAKLFDRLELVAVEPNPSSIAIVQEWLATERALAAKISLFKGYAMDFFQRNPDSMFDVIFEDAFTPAGKPSDLWSRAFLTAAQSRLKPNGLYITHSHPTQVVLEATPT